MKNLIIVGHVLAFFYFLAGLEFFAVAGSFSLLAWGPNVINYTVFAVVKEDLCKKLSLAGMLLFMLWSVAIYLEAIVIHPNHSSGFAFFVIIPFALPVLLPIWIICIYRSNRQPPASRHRPRD